jgi:hypothetical protein
LMAPWSSTLLKHGLALLLLDESARLATLHPDHKVNATA